MLSRTNRPVDPDKMLELMEKFHRIVEPWCETNEFSLHRAFEVSRESEPEIYHILSELWRTTSGKEYLRSLFSSRGGVLRPKP